MSGTICRRTSPAVLAAILVVGAFACGGGDAGSGGSEESGQAPDGMPAQETPAESQESTFSVDESLLPEGVTVAMVEEGRSLFTGGGICLTCHLADGTGGPLAPDLTDDQWLNVDGEYSSIVELVKTGVAQPLEYPGAMLPRAGMPLTDAQVEAVAAYAYMLSRM